MFHSSLAYELALKFDLAGSFDLFLKFIKAAFLIVNNSHRLNWINQFTTSICQLIICIQLGVSIKDVRGIAPLNQVVLKLSACNMQSTTGVKQVKQQSFFLKALTLVMDCKFEIKTHYAHFDNLELNSLHMVIYCTLLIKEV